MAAASSSSLAAADPIASSNFAGVESPLFENGAWAPIVSLAPDGMRFQKNNSAFPNQPNGPNNNHAGVRTTAAIPDDHYSEIVVGHVGNRLSYVGPFVRVQTSGAALDSMYLWWGSQATGDNNFLFRMDANGTSYRAAAILPHSPVADGDRLRMIARGPVLYGLKNGVAQHFTPGRVQQVTTQRQVPLTRADRRQIDAVLDRFVTSAILRHHPIGAWAVSTKGLRAGTTRRQWARGDVPVFPYPARGRHFRANSLRALLAGKLDLTRAEAVQGVIEADSRAELKVALGQLAGGMARPLQELRDDLLNLLADVEASLDFADEDIRFVGQKETLLRLSSALAHVTLVGKQLDARASGASTVRYEGSPALKVSATGASSVTKK